MNNTGHEIQIAGRTVTIRPMCHADADLEKDFVRGLSDESRRFRFLGAVRELTADELRDYCDVDGHHSMAFVALASDSAGSRIVGVSRYAPNADSTAREIAVTVADDWQNRGIGTRLAKALIQHAREHGVRKLYSIDLSENAHMRKLAADLGMKTSPDPADVRQVIYELNLADLPVAATSHAVTRQA